MGHLSVKGIARKYRNTTGSFSLRDAFWSWPNNPDDWSVRDRLEDVAEKRINYSLSECIYGWRVKYTQVWTHITIRIELDPDSDVGSTTLSNLRTTWANTIESWWSDKWGGGRSGEITCPFTFNVIWTSSNEDQTVRVRTCSGSCRSNMGLWDTLDPGSTAAHEFGHMLGHPDEYTDSNCPSRSPVNTGTIMDNNSQTFPSRYFTAFASELGLSVRSI